MEPRLEQIDSCDRDPRLKANRENYACSEPIAGQIKVNELVAKKSRSETTSENSPRFTENFS